MHFAKFSRHAKLNLQMFVFAILFVCVFGELRLPPKNDPPVQYSYTAVATAYFDANGNQAGYKTAAHGVIGPIPDRFPQLGEQVHTDTKKYVIEGVLGHGTGSAVYRATCLDQESANAAIKFQRYANEERQFSVETDYEVLKRTAQFGNMFPQVSYLSGLGSISNGEGVFNLRYLVMELLGSPVWALMRKSGFKLPLKTVASVGVQAVEILEKLHSLGIVHGDVHLENVLFHADREDDDGNYFSDRIVLGDYGKSTIFIDPVTREHIPDRTVEFNQGRNMLFLSPYELAFGAPSRREDVFRLVESLARMIDERRYASWFKPLQNNRQALLNAKLTTPLGEILPGVNPRLSELYSYGRSLGFSQQPNYDYMRDQLLAIIRDCGLEYHNKVILDV